MLREIQSAVSCGTFRSGVLSRRTNCNLEIYHEADLPKGAMTEIALMREKLKEEGVLNCNGVDGNEQKSPSQNKSPNLTKSRKRRRSSASRESTSKESLRIPPVKHRQTEIPTPEFSEITDELYTKTYGTRIYSVQPDFPIKTAIDSCFTALSDSENDDEYDYDAGSDDDEWLDHHPQITRTRLEYIFTQLNKRDTHVKEKAIGALRPPYHPDFHVVFPYWKEKRLGNENVASCKIKSSRQYKFWQSSDPTQTFCGTIVKKRTTHRGEKRKSLKQLGTETKDVHAVISRAESARKMLQKLKFGLRANLHKEEQLRADIFQKLSDLDRRFAQLNEKTHDESSDKCISATSTSSPSLKVINNKIEQRASPPISGRLRSNSVKVSKLPKGDAVEKVRHRSRKSLIREQ